MLRALIATWHNTRAVQHYRFATQQREHKGTECERG